MNLIDQINSIIWIIGLISRGGGTGLGGGAEVDGKTYRLATAMSSSTNLSIPQQQQPQQQQQQHLPHLEDSRPNSSENETYVIQVLNIIYIIIQLFNR